MSGQATPQTKDSRAKRQNKPNTIRLFTVVSDNPNSPVLNGYVNIDGVDYSVALWQATQKNGEPWYDSNGNPSWQGNVKPQEATE